MECVVSACCSRSLFGCLPFWVSLLAVDFHICSPLKCLSSAAQVSQVELVSGHTGGAPDRYTFTCRKWSSCPGTQAAHRPRMSLVRLDMVAHLTHLHFCSKMQVSQVRNHVEAHGAHAVWTLRAVRLDTFLTWLTCKNASEPRGSKCSGHTRDTHGFTKSYIVNPKTWDLLEDPT